VSDEPPTASGEQLEQRSSIHRVRKAYEQVYDQLRELITSGELKPGERLPNETVLAFPSPGTLQDDKFFSLIGADGGTG
jgi:hypothetical protein